VQKTFIISARGPSAGGLRASDVQMKSKRAIMMKRPTNERRGENEKMEGKIKK
jgi:hypothetical protein